MDSARKQVCVIGVGFVGQHLVDVFSRQHQVIGFDVSPKRVAALKTVYATNPNVTIQSTTDGMEAADLFCISVPTLLKDNNQAIDTSYVEAAVETVARHARPGATVVMESSVSVGMTRALLGRLRAQGVYVGFSPERVDPGRTFPAAEDIAKVVSGIDAESLAAVQALYCSVYSSVVPVSTLETAEMTKLFENCFRMINIAFVNEVADSCSQFGICPHELVSAAATKPFGFMPFWAGAGIGGHCIPVNPSFLFVNNKLPLLKAATEAMQARPSTLASRLVEEHPEASRILVVGAAFKPGEVLTTYAPGEAMARELAAMGKTVLVHDPLVRDAGAAPHLNFITDGEWTAASLDASFDVVVVAMGQQGVDFGVLSQLNRVRVVCHARLPGVHREVQVVNGGVPLTTVSPSPPPPTPSAGLTATPAPSPFAAAACFAAAAPAVAPECDGADGEAADGFMDLDMRASSSEASLDVLLLRSESASCLSGSGSFLDIAGASSAAARGVPMWADSRWAGPNYAEHVKLARLLTSA